MKSGGEAGASFVGTYLSAIYHGASSPTTFLPGALTDLPGPGAASRRKRTRARGSVIKFPLHCG